MFYLDNIIATIKYNYLNLPDTVQMQNGVVKQVSNYYPYGMEYGESADDQTEI